MTEYEALYVYIMFSYIFMFGAKAGDEDMPGFIVFVAPVSFPFALGLYISRIK